MSVKRRGGRQASTTREARIPAQHPRPAHPQLSTATATTSTTRAAAPAAARAGAVTT